MIIHMVTNLVCQMHMNVTDIFLHLQEYFNGESCIISCTYRVAQKKLTFLKYLSTYHNLTTKSDTIFCTLSRCHFGGEKQYHFHVCKKSFSQAFHLRSHIQTQSHRKTCGQRGSSSVGPQHHRDIATGEHSYFCVICNKGYAQSRGLMKHVKNCHC